VLCIFVFVFLFLLNLEETETLNKLVIFFIIHLSILY